MKNAIAWMTRNSVAANLLMLFIVVLGIVGLTAVVQEVFPEFSLDAIQVRVTYPGASPEEVEEGIVRRVEEQIESVDGIRRISSVSAENVGVVTAELELGTDAKRALDDIKAEVDRITTFPVEAEEPIVQELTNRQQALQLALHGNVSERSLKELANHVKDDLTAMSDISYVRVNGVRNYEISIEIPEQTLRAYDLTLGEVGTIIRRNSLDLPGGTLQTRGEDILVRTKGQHYTAQDFRQLIIRARPDGTAIRLGDIATIHDDFEDNDLITRFDGEPAALVGIFRTSDERVLDIVDAVQQYVDEQLRPSLPEGIQVDIWQNDGRLLKSRFDLLIRNGRMGLILVLLALALFLDLRLAFWVASGIFISFMGAFGVMIYLGVSINMISLFAFILALGLVVDDAIVIGENIFTEQSRGVPPLEAAVRGATRLAGPVVFAVLTTVAAFSPLMYAPGTIGKIMKTMPIIVIAVLTFSLVESLFILPAHLNHRRAKKAGEPNVVMRYILRIQAAVARAMDWNINGPLERTLRFSTRHYGIVLASAVAVLIFFFGIVAGGYVKFSFFPDVEGDNVFARLELPEGTSAEQTERVTAYLEAKGREAADALEATLPDGHPALVEHVFTSVGNRPSADRGPSAGTSLGLITSNVAEVNFQLVSAEEREITSAAFEAEWRKRVGEVPNVKSLQFTAAAITLGKAIQAELSAPDAAVLDRAVKRLEGSLREFAGVYEVEDDRNVGKREVKLNLLPRARTLGVTVDDLARQVRAGFYGAEALRIQRGRDEVKVMVRLPKDERNTLTDLGDLRIMTPAGAEIPLSEVAEARFGFGPSTINRRDRRRVVTVTADVDNDVVSTPDVVGALETGVLAEMTRDYPGFRYTFEGQEREQKDTVNALLRGFIIALFAIYALLAIPFGSYAQPFIVMSAIPFGFVGAIFGHVVMGLKVGVLSMFGIVGLSGVVVNDSLVMIDMINEFRRQGMPMAQAIIEGGKRRFRPILLTSLTTFLGVLPLILERSVQAQFLIPMAVSLGFGILFATFITLVVVPALAMLQHDAARFARRLFGHETAELPGDGVASEEGTLVAEAATRSAL